MKSERIFILSDTCETEIMLIAYEKVSSIGFGLHRDVY